MRKSPLICIVMAGGLLTSAHATVLYYSQTFNATESMPLDDYNWLANHGPDAVAYPLDTTESTENPWVSSGPSGGGDNSGNGTATGYLYHFSALNPNDRTIWWTNDFTPFPVSQLDSFQVDLRNGDTSESVQFVFQVDGSTAWYRPNDTFNSSVSDEWSNDLTLDVDSISSINFLNIVPGSAFSTGAATSMPTIGDVTAVGLYNFDIDGAVRIDNFEVYVIPEPTTYAFMGGLLALAVVSLRRRK